MGFRLNGRHTDEFGIAVTTRGIPYIPSKRQTTVEVNGRDGQYIFEDGYNNITIQLDCAIGGYEISERRKRAREIAIWLSAPGSLIFDYEQDVVYKVVKSVSDVSASVVGKEYRDEFSISFECEPYQQQTFYNDGLTWDDVDSSWPYVNMPWDGYERTFNVVSGQTVNVWNAGTYKARPKIVLTGVAASITIGGFTFVNLSGTVYIDCKNKLVYSIVGNSKVNQIVNFSGEFPELNVGTNQFLITGSITNLSIEFDYKNTYL